MGWPAQQEPTEMSGLRKKPHVLIAGAGIGGLTAALALLRKGIDVDVDEQAPELKEIGAGLHVAPNGTRVLLELGLEEAVDALGIATLKRSPLAPDIPTLTEAGLADFESDSWYGVLVPAKTPMDIIAKQHASIAKALSGTEVRGRLHAVGLEPVGGTPEEFRGFLASKMKTYSTIIKDANIRPGQ
jgi:glycine/D-amino acid oxidase-like deaminating enzyme